MLHFTFAFITRKGESSVLQVYVFENVMHCLQTCMSCEFLYCFVNCFCFYVFLLRKLFADAYHSM